jgi:hypothetical protein
MDDIEEARSHGAGADIATESDQCAGAPHRAVSTAWIRQTIANRVTAQAYRRPGGERPLRRVLHPRELLHRTDQVATAASVRTLSETHRSDPLVRVVGGMDMEFMAKLMVHLETVSTVDRRAMVRQLPSRHRCNESAV